MTPTKETTFNIAKGLFHVRNAIHYFEHVKSQPEIRHEAKHFVNLHLGKLNGVLNDITSRIPTESAMALRAELESDTMVFEAINNKLCALTPEQRWEVEEFINEKILTNA
jgi:hypothetical protein